MSTVKFRFFNYEKAVALGRKKTFAGELIKHRSFPHTHSEFQFSAQYNHLSFSATIEDAFKGCRFKLIEYSHEWWDTVEKEITPAHERLIWDSAHTINGKKYDLVGLLSFGTPWKIIRPHRDRYWCSESNAVITWGCLYYGPREIHPEALYQEVK